MRIQSFSLSTASALLVLLLAACGNAPPAPPAEDKEKEGKEADEEPEIGYERFDAATDSEKAKPLLHLCSRIFFHMRHKEPKKLYDLFSDRAKQQVSFEAFLEQERLMLEYFGASKGLLLLELHCMTIPDTLDMSDLDARPGIRVESEYLPAPVLLTAPVTGEVTLALAESMTDRQDTRFWVTLLLVKREQGWRLHTFQVKPRLLEGRNGYFFLEQADRWEKKGQARVAFLYRYLGASLFTPSLYLFSQAALDGITAFLSKEAPPHLPHHGFRPSEQWQYPSGGTSFEVVLVAPNLLEAEICLEIRYLSALADLDGEPAEAERMPWPG